MTYVITRRNKELHIKQFLKNITIDLRGITC